MTSPTTSAQEPLNDDRSDDKKTSFWFLNIYFLHKNIASICA